jgi:hypothetical protein
MTKEHGPNVELNAASSFGIRHFFVIPHWSFVIIFLLSSPPLRAPGSCRNWCKRGAAAPVRCTAGSIALAPV